MSAEYICDGCGKRELAVHYGKFGGSRNWHKPEKWYQRQDEDGPQDACSRQCIDKIAEQTGKSRVILPW